MNLHEMGMKWHHNLCKSILMFRDCLNLKSDWMKLTAKFFRWNSWNGWKKKKIQIERFSVVRNIFNFDCYTGLSFSDIAKLSRNHLQHSADKKIGLFIDRSKTNNRCRIPILPKAREILKRYEDYPKISNKDILLPVLTNQKINGYL